MCVHWLWLRFFLILVCMICIVYVCERDLCVCGSCIECVCVYSHTQETIDRCFSMIVVWACHGIHVEVKGQHWISILPSPLFGIGFLTSCCVCQTLYLVSSWGFSCALLYQVYRDSGHSNSGPHICTRSASPNWTITPIVFWYFKSVCVCMHTHMLKYAHTVYAQKHMCGGQRITLRSDWILQTESRMSGPATSTFLPELSYQLEVLGMTVIPAFRKEAEENCGKF